MRPLLPTSRWSLTPPFHPYLHECAGGLFSAALSLRSPWADVIRHRALWSPEVPQPLLIAAIEGSQAPHCNLPIDNAVTPAPSYGRLVLKMTTF